MPTGRSQRPLYLPNDYVIADPQFSAKSPNDRAAQVAAYVRGWYEENRESWWRRTKEVPRIDSFMLYLVDVVRQVQSRADEAGQAQMRAVLNEQLPEDFIDQLRAIAKTLDNEWGIAALKVRAAADEIARLQDALAAQHLDRAAAMAREPYVPDHPRPTATTIADALHLLATALDADEPWSPEIDAAKAQAIDAHECYQRRRAAEHAAKSNAEARQELNPSQHPEVAGLDHTGFRAEEDAAAGPKPPPDVNGIRMDNSPHGDGRPFDGEGRLKSPEELQRMGFHPSEFATGSHASRRPPPASDD